MLSSVIWAKLFHFSQGWSSEGCRVTGSNDTGTLCECNHMTNFAILMSSDRQVSKTTLYPSTLKYINLKR